MTRATVGAAVLLLLAAVCSAQTPGRVLVVPFDNVRHEPRYHWMTEASAVILADELNALGRPAIDRDERVRAYEQLHLPWSASLSRATVIKVGELVGGAEVIVGAITLDGADLTVTAHRIRIDIGRTEPEVRERGPLTDLFPIFERLARRLVTDAGVAASRARPPRPPLDAFENYVKGLIAENP